LLNALFTQKFMKLAQIFSYPPTSQMVLFFRSGLLAVGLFLSLSLQAQNTTAQSLLWKVSGPGLQQPSYLFGTIHAICNEDIHISAAMHQALEESQRLVLEVNITDPAELQQFQAGMQKPSSQTLSSSLSPQEYRQLARFYQDSLRIPLDQLQHMKPFFIGSLLYPKLLGCPVMSYEVQLSQLMGQQIKPVLGLESAQDQLRVLDAIPYQEQTRLLLEAVQDFQKLKDGYWNMVVSYKNADLQSLYHIVREVSMGMKNYEKLLLTDRNRRWMPNIETLVRQQPSFIAVGAAHLPGEEGLINLLRRRGYTVEAVVE
jgi:uncharacterized protein